MSQWHCAINGQKYGPVGEDDLKLWITQGRVRETDLVWMEGMTNWRTAGSIPAFSGLFAAGSIPPVMPEQARADSPVPSSMGGTSGASLPAEITRQARTLLQGRWGLAIGFCFLLGLISAGISLVTQSVPGLQIASWVVEGPLRFGGVIFFLHYTRNGKPETDMLFAGFRYFANAMGVYFFTSIFILLWMLLLIVPGIIAAYAYSMSFYILADDPSLDGLEAIRRSKKMMQGHKARLFYLNLRFIGWAFLCILTLGIGLLWLIPYMTTAQACFYNDLLPPKQEAAA